MKIGIVLSGGGIRGISHLGVLKALKNFGITPDYISGTSAGAIVGATLASGIDPEKAFNIYMDTKLWRFFRPALGSLGLVNIESTNLLFKEYLLKENIEDLEIPLTITAVNFSEGKAVQFTKGPLIKAIHASCCIPGIFKPVMINDQMYVDGGIINNFPIEPLMDKCDFIIGSSCNHLNKVDKITGIRNLLSRASVMSINHDMERKAKYCNLLIEPKGLGAISTFDLKRAEDIYWIAYEETLTVIKNNPEVYAQMKGK
ncbi:MAG: patatin-like phospholipase family protein [Pedobacter sp.]|nr:patatin-like phospholipase family protein [Pedobacter sp.]